MPGSPVSRLRHRNAAGRAAPSYDETTTCGLDQTAAAAPGDRRLPLEQYAAALEYMAADAFIGRIVIEVAQ